MSPQSKRLLKLLLASTTLLGASSCGTTRPTFDPDAYRANYHIEAIVNEREQVVYCYEPEFSDYACMHKTKWEELRKLVQILQVSPQQKAILLKSIEHAIKHQ